MGPPRTRAPRPPSRGRFQEGSMNDRASAVPPVDFLGPAELAALERPVAVEAQASNTINTTTTAADSKATDKSQDKLKQNKRGSKLLDQIWEGMRGRLRFKKDVEEDKEREKSVAPTPAVAPMKKAEEERPSREEVLANYHELVASGFFSSHAIQSSRQPGPKPPPHSRPTPAGPRPSTSHGAKPPAWPLAPARPASPVVRSPASASSRGTKRAAAAEDDEAENATPRKLRKSASRDIAMPKLRSVTSRRAISRRSFSTTGTPSSSTTADQPAPREPNKLTKRIPGRHFVPERASSTRRNVSESAGVKMIALEAAPGSTRVLRPRKSAEPLSVVPDTNRGIPSVPSIPVKFTYGEDRENDGPWRGLRR